MKYNPEIHHRRSIRLKNYDYSKRGLYFITICTKDQLSLFGNVVGAGSKPALPNDMPIQNDKLSSKRAGLEPAPTEFALATVKMEINDWGRIVQNTWFDLVNHIDNIKLHEFIVMPNHLHGIIEIIDNMRAGSDPAPTRKTKSLSEIVRQLKTFSARRVNKERNMPGVPLWQRNYYEHIIRDEESYHKIADYIINNPMRWKEDKYYNGHFAQ